MPKRLSALAFAPAQGPNPTLLAADKTGEVYGLPLLPSASGAEATKADEEQHPRSEALSRHAPLRSHEAGARKGPEASTATVHSSRNRRALEAQLRVAGTAAPRRDDVPAEPAAAREHELLLGHVSIVTDMLFATAPGGRGGGRPRGYVVTADRDEHIRVARAPPQAYVTEAFCLGHGAFVSRLCLASAEVLASAGGEDDVFAWRWREGAPVAKVGIRAAVEEARRGARGGEAVAGEAGEGIAVSGLWRFETAAQEVRTANLWKGN